MDDDELNREGIYDPVHDRQVPPLGPDVKPGISGRLLNIVWIVLCVAFVVVLSALSRCGTNKF